MPNPIEFKLLAPNNRGVKLLGSFSNWDDIPMQQDDKGYFTTSIELEDGVYQYQYKVQSGSSIHEPDEWVCINDPYTTEIDPSTGKGILKIKGGLRIVDDYVWQHDGVSLPQNEALVIYELLISDFFHGDANHPRGRYTNVAEKLDYLCELGVNAIELLPVNETPGDYNWGYIPSYFFAPQPNYGSTQELKQLIDECHARGMRVLLDQLYNHSSDESPLLQIDRDYWYYHDRHHPDADPRDHWGPEFNYEYVDEIRGTRPAWDFMGDVLRYWIENFHIDGIRYDALKELDNFDFLFWAAQEGKKAAAPRPFYNVGEHIPEKPDLIAPNGPMDGCWHETFYHTLKSHLSGDAFDLDQLKQAIDPTLQDYPRGITTAVNYLCNHDQTRLLLDLGDRSIVDDAAVRRAKLGAVLLLTAVGIPLIWMGEEFGDDTSINAEDTDQQLNWALLERDRNRNLFEHYKRLIALRKQNKALQTANVEFFHENEKDKVIAYTRWSDDGSQIAVVANFSEHPLKDYNIAKFPNDGVWQEHTNDYSMESCNSQITIDLEDYSAQVFVFHPQL